MPVTAFFEVSTSKHIYLDRNWLSHTFISSVIVEYVIVVCASHVQLHVFSYSTLVNTFTRFLG